MLPGPDALHSAYAHRVLSGMYFFHLGAAFGQYELAFFNCIVATE